MVTSKYFDTESTMLCCYYYQPRAEPTRLLKQKALAYRLPCLSSTMKHRYRILRDRSSKSDPAVCEPAVNVPPEAERELLHLLKSRGVPSICDSISKEINYAWAVTSGFRTLGNVGNFYFACAGQAFGYNPAHDFFAAGGMQLALFALHKFTHNEMVLLPVLECIHIFSKLHVDGALDFLAVADAREVLMKCIRFHDNKHNVIASTCRALGCLVMNDLVKESISTPALASELLGVLKRYATSLAVCRAVLVPLGFLVTDASITEVFVDANGIALVLTAVKNHVRDTETVWHGIGILNALNTQTFDGRILYAIYGFTGIPRLVEALANHLDTEEIAVEGFQLLSRLAALPDTFRVINQCKVLDLAYVALFAYSGPQHRHTRMEIKKTLHNFQKCTISDPQELASREQASHRDVTLYALFVVAAWLMAAFSFWNSTSTTLATGMERALQQSRSVHHSRTAPQPTSSALMGLHGPDDVWAYLTGPLCDVAFASHWYNGDAFAADVESQLGVIDRVNLLLGGVQLRMLRGQPKACGGAFNVSCYPEYDPSSEAKETLPGAEGTMGRRWTASDSYDAGTKQVDGRLAVYPDSGYRVFLARNKPSGGSASCDARCQLGRLRSANWIDVSTRALFVEFNVFNPVENVHLATTLLFEFAATGGVVASMRVTPIAIDRYGRLFVFSPLFCAEIAVLLGLAWHCHKQVDKVLRYRHYYFTVPVHVVDFVVVALWSTAIALRISFHLETSHSLLASLAADDAFVNLASAAKYARRELDVQAWCACLMWWRLLRLAKTLKPLEKTLDKFEHAEGLLGSYLLLLAVFTLVFAQSGHLLFLSSVEEFTTLGKSISSASRALVREWDASTVPDPRRGSVWGVLLRLCSVFVILNVAVAILRERFHRRTVDQDAPLASVPDGLSILQLAKRQLTVSGLPTEPATVPHRLRQAAQHGLDRLHLATRQVFAIKDDPIELTELKKVWGLEGKQDDPRRRPIHIQDGQTTFESVLADAEADGRLLDEHLRLLKARLQEAFHCLELVQRMHHERVEARRARAERLKRLRINGN